jgi:hypothetical protein
MPKQDWQDRTAITGLPGQASQDMTHQESHDRMDTGQAGLVQQNRTSKVGQAEWDMQNGAQYIFLLVCKTVKLHKILYFYFL